MQANVVVPIITHGFEDGGALAFKEDREVKNAIYDAWPTADWQQELLKNFDAWVHRALVPEVGGTPSAVLGLSGPFSYGCSLQPALHSHFLRPASSAAAGASRG